MKTKFKILMLFSAILLNVSSYSQSLTPIVISSGGGYYTSTSATLSFTVAEMTMVQTFSSTGNILTQGFQQPEILSVGIPETPVASGDVLIYPNPTNGNFVLSFFSNDNSETTLKLYDLTGQLVMEKQVSPSTGLNTVNFDISAFNQGMYILELSSSNSNGEKRSDYHKINLVY